MKAPKLLLTAAVRITPFNGPNGNPLTDVSAFAEVLDHIGNFCISRVTFQSLIVVI